MEAVMCSAVQVTAMEYSSQEEEEAMIRLFPYEARRVGSTHAQEFRSLSEMSKSTGFEEHEVTNAMLYGFGSLGDYHFCQR